MIPTKAIRHRTPDANVQPGSELAKRKAVPKVQRGVLIKIGTFRLMARLLDTPTARRIWYALPIWSTAQQWGQGALHFDTHIGTGRERGARWNVERGDLAYWVEQDCIILGYDATPISRPGEIRLPSPANIWAHTDDDVSVLRRITPGTRIDVTMLVLQPPGGSVEAG